MNYYVDSCIWIDFFNNRFDGLKPLGEFAFQFFKKCLKNNNNVLFSKMVVFELKNNGLDFFEISKDFCFILEEVFPSKNDLEKIKSLSIEKQIPFGDAFHYVLSKTNKAILVSRDNHLLSFNETKLPEELI
ncbi:MAG: type II toxin-antitoxin system VapC family toxin [Candidatus ainarchaeum sp.]|nr:type II toxin-antitoxin system VapC family toxin [Candidatus ainarchaeum sp.]